jgi:hypothetical protein
MDTSVTSFEVRARTGADGYGTKQTRIKRLLNCLRHGM